jgi:hypothetical protein
MAAQHRVHRRGRDPERPPDHVRSFAQLGARTQDRLLDAGGSPPWRGARSTRAIVQPFAASSSIDPLRRRLPRAAHDERRSGDRHPSGNEIAQALTLTDAQDRICMKIHGANNVSGNNS